MDVETPGRGRRQFKLNKTVMIPTEGSIPEGL